MTVPAQIPTNVSTANGLTTTFPYNFRILDKSHLRVTVNGVAKTVDVDYTVSEVGDNDGGNVVFAVAPADGAIVRRTRLMPFERLVNYLTGGDFLASVVNGDQDAPVMMIQQLAALAMMAVEDSLGGFVWDAQGRRIINVGDAVLDMDAVNHRTLLEALGDFTSLGLNTAPRKWDFIGDGVTTTFFIPGADVSDPLMYEVVVGEGAREPTDSFTVTIAQDPAGSFITLAAPPGNAVQGWVRLWGYAKPVGNDLMTNQTFIDLLKTLITNTLYETTNVLELGPVRSLIPLADVAGTALTVDGTHESYLLRCTNAAATTLTVRANTGSGTLDWETNPIAAPYFSVKQHGAGQVTIAGEGGVTITPPPGYLAKTRAQGSIVTATADYIAGGQWTLSGDLAIDEAYVPGGALARFNKVLAAAHSNTTVTPTTPAGFTANVAAGKSYRVRLLGTYQTAATTTGCIVGILGAAGAGGTVAGRAKGAVSAAAVATELSVPLTALSGAGSTLTTTDVSAINTPHHVEFDAVFVCTANGTLSLVFASESAGSAAQLNAGAHFSVEEIQVTP